ncbi:acyltransferase [Pedobacter sp. UBA4863]|uniref:acyltransferase family protein n=1 Tax=Pedobacter sp. UBA4863 TaxID=1947060 RepID=UPI0025D59B7B|nr:acyltransferase [Pedobacter sp. UBA4863]
MSKLHLRNLNGIRALAALMVINSHLPVTYTFENNHLQGLYSLTKNGQLGVYIFFLLSGFLITRIILEDKEKFKLKTFYLKRIYRIWPLYYLCFFINLCIFPFVNKDRVYDHYSFEKYFFFIQNFDTYEIAVKKLNFYAPITINWSVSIEEQFYLFWPLIFFFIKNSTIRIIIIASMMVAALLKTANIESTTGNSYFTTYAAIWDLGLGGLLAYLHWQLRNIKICIPKIITLLIYIAALVFLTNLIPIDISFTLRKILTSIIIAFFVAEQCTNHKNLFNLDRVPFFYHIGKISYGLYLLHPLVFLLVDSILASLFGYGTIRNILILLIGIPAIFLIANVSYKYFESYFLKLKAKLD